MNAASEVGYPRLDRFTDVELTSESSERGSRWLFIHEPLDEHATSERERVLRNPIVAQQAPCLRLIGQPVTR